MTGKSAGFDYGNKTFLTSDAGDKIESPEFLKQSLKVLRSLNKALSRKVKGSNNWYRAARALARQHRKVAREKIGSGNLRPNFAQMTRFALRR